MRIITLGSDPEFFVLDKTGKPYPATPFAIGSKEHPIPIPELGQGFYEQQDNLSFEGNIPPCYTKQEFVKNVTLLRNYFLSKVLKYGYSISPNGIERFPKRMLKTKQGMEFGCSSVVSSWDSSGTTNIISVPTPNLKDVDYRVSGFHIHLGLECFYSKPRSNLYSLIIGRLFDLFLTLPSHKIKDEPERMLSYGKFGMIRIKSYGVECRTLSSFFTQEEYLSWVWDQVKKMENFINYINEEDLKKIVKNAHVVSSALDVENAFSDIFSTFKDTSFLSKFDETKNIKIYERKTNNDKKSEDNTDNNVYSSHTTYYYCTKATSDCITTTIGR